MANTATQKKLKTFHATVHVTRLEEWCVEAETAEQARALLVAGEGHRCLSATACTLRLSALAGSATAMGAATGAGCEG